MYANDDYKDFWNEYKLVQETKHTAVVEDEDHTKLEVDEVENNTELLRVMGMDHLVEVFNECHEITDQQLDQSLRQLSKRQADTVKKRVRALNYTVKQSKVRKALGGPVVGLGGARAGRGSRQRKPDIRNVFKADLDFEKTEPGADADVNRNIETRSRSRSATPDSLDLDSIQSTHTDTQNGQWPTSSKQTPNNLVGSVPSFVKIFHQSDGLQPSIDPTLHSHRSSSESEKDTLRRTPSAPPTCNRGPSSPSSSYDSVDNDNCDASNNLTSILPSTEMFGRPNWSHYRGAVASNSEGIELLGFNRIGTMYCPRSSRERGRMIRDTASTSIKSTSTSTSTSTQISNRNVDALIDSRTIDLHRSINIPSNGPMSFEMAFNKNNSTSTSTSDHQQVHLMDSYETNINSNNIYDSSHSDGRLSVNQVTDLDFKDMTPILWLEICMIFDKHSLKIHRRKPLKRKRKEDGNLFGVNLSTLVMRDYQFINSNDSSSSNINNNNSNNMIVIPIPLIIRDLLSRLSMERRLQEEGLLRVAGNKQRVESLCNELEQHFYTQQEHILTLLNQSTSHELVSVLKKILRDLPQPLFTIELIHLFYETHAIQDHNDQLNALNLLVLLLPVQNRTTLYALLQFLIDVVHHESYNKMNLHNVAMIIAPSLFPPRYIFLNNRNCGGNIIKNDLNSEIEFAATCCKLTEVLIEHVDLLQTIPVTILKQAKQRNNNSSSSSSSFILDNNNCNTDTIQQIQQQQQQQRSSGFIKQFNNNIEHNQPSDTTTKQQLNKHIKLFTKKDKK